MSRRERIAEARKRTKLSLKAFGQALNPPVSHETVRKWESGENFPEAKRYAEMERVSGVRAAWIESGVGPKLVDSEADPPTVPSVVDQLRRMTAAERLQVIAEAARMGNEEPGESPQPPKPARRR